VPRKNKNARKREKPRPLYKIRLNSFPKRDKHDIRPGRVVMVAEYCWIENEKGGESMTKVGMVVYKKQA